MPPRPRQRAGSPRTIPAHPAGNGGVHPGDGHPTGGSSRIELVAPTVLALIPVALAGCSLLATSGGDQTTFLALVHTLDVTAILVSSYTALLPELVVVLFVLWVYHKHPISGAGSNRERRGTILFWLPVLLVDFLLLPHRPVFLLPSVLLSILLLGYLFWPPALVRIHSWVGSRTFLVDGWRAIPSIALIGLLAMLVIFPVASGTMWIPPEVIGVQVESVGTGIVEVKGTGYVLEEKEGQVLVLWHDGRGITRYDAKAVKYRQVCHFDGEHKKRILVRDFRMPPQTVRTPHSQDCLT